MIEETKLWNALTFVRLDAKKTIEKSERALLGRRLYGWSQERHEAYWNKQIEQARAVIDYCTVRQMQINPD